MKYVYDRSTPRPFENGAIGYWTPGGFRSWARFENVPCDDHVRRLVYVTGEPDTMFSTPASVRVKGKTVSGFVSFDNDPAGPRFTAYSYAKNAKLIPPGRKLAKALTGE